jgi:large subunit ribosomal protein L14
MAYKDSFFGSIDNTGVKLVRCLKIFKSRQAKPGSLIIVTIKQVLPHRKVKKGQIYRAVVVRLKRPIKRLNSFIIKYVKNSIVILKKSELVPLGTRIKGSVFYELRLLGYMKIISLSAFLL